MFIPINQTPQNRMASYDRMPSSIRSVLSGTVFDFNANQVYAYFQRNGEERTLSHLKMSEERMIREKMPAEAMLRGF